MIKQLEVNKSILINYDTRWVFPRVSCRLAAAFVVNNARRYGIYRPIGRDRRRRQTDREEWWLGPKGRCLCSSDLPSSSIATATAAGGPSSPTITPARYFRDFSLGSKFFVWSFESDDCLGVFTNLHLHLIWLILYFVITRVVDLSRRQFNWSACRS